MRYTNQEFKDALVSMSGDEIQSSPSQPKRETEDNSLSSLPNSDWQNRMLNKLDRAVICLQISRDGQPGRDYLKARGLHQGTWAVYSLGFSAVVKDPKLANKAVQCIRPAVIIPWLDNDGLVTCINSRFIDNQPEGLRYKASNGSRRTLFGLNAIWRNSALMICEGEFNCCSIHQANASAGGLGMAAVSIGGEDPSELTLTLLKALVRNYERVFCWIDKPERSQAIVGALNHSAHALRSPDRDGAKLDANAMLQRGVLTDFLRALLADVRARTLESSSKGIL